MHVETTGPALRKQQNSAKVLKDIKREGPLVSVVIPLYNAEEFVYEAVQSVLNQTYSNLEVIVVDDCSTDSSLQVLQPLTTDLRLKIEKSSTNQGVAEARNRGVTASHGDFICFLDSDDTWEKEKVERQLYHLLDSGADICCTGYRHVGRSGAELRRVTPPPDNICYEKLLNQNIIGCSTVMAKAHVLKQESFKKIGHEDFCYWLDLLQEKLVRVVGIEEPLVNYRVFGSGLSRNKLRAAVWTWRIYRERQNLSFQKSLFHFSVYMVKSIHKYSNIYALSYVRS